MVNKFLKRLKELKEGFGYKYFFEFCYKLKPKFKSNFYKLLAARLIIVMDTYRSKFLLEAFILT
ncbi:hypothetical protein BafPKo_J0011 (plasmid) [Borreliella afzelii PKo]|uniref:Uncharacterized protein n=1 Tax=Borreliella afzelii (strain PKo) TaxID=390236 RepID=G0ITY8_BORAP|nr:hypothetical protein BafPKo_J0011 [Borreliella afzelii PKo]